MITGKCILVKIMPSIQPWLYPNKHSVDRIAYIPLQSAHILQYQEEFVDYPSHRKALIPKLF